MHTTMALASCALAYLLGPAALAQTVRPDDARAVAKEAFLWGMHPVAIYHLRYNQRRTRKARSSSASTACTGTARR